MPWCACHTTASSPRTLWPAMQALASKEYYGSRPDIALLLRVPRGHCANMRRADAPRHPSRIMDALTIPRLHFAFTVPFRDIFPEWTRGLALLRLVLKTMALRPGGEHYNRSSARPMVN